METSRANAQYKRNDRYNLLYEIKWILSVLWIFFVGQTRQIQRYGNQALGRRQVMIWAFLWIFCWGWWFSVFYPSPSFRKWFVESPHKANTINKNRQFNMGARKRKFWVSIEFQMKSGLRCKLWTILYCKLQFSSLLAYFQNSPSIKSLNRN